jgi:transposase
METLVARCAGLDVHKDSVTACVRVPDGHGGRQAETRRFTTTTAGLVLLAQWLGSFGVTRVGMESTGCYWKPVVRHEVPRVRAEVKGLRRRPVAAGR